MDALFQAVANALNKLEPSMVLLISILGWLVFSCTKSTKQSLDNNTNALGEIKEILAFLKAKIER